MAQQASRLQRLLTLLDTGSSQATRFTAARQIGDIAKSHPKDLNSLLKKVSQYLRSKNWDTRVAAAHAVGAIAQNVAHTSIQELFASIDAEMSEVVMSDSVRDTVIALLNCYPKAASGLSFSSFNISRVLEFGALLLASVGQEYDIANDNSKSPAERIARQKQNLRRRLGLDVCEQFMDVNDMIRDEDLLVHKVHPHGNGMGHGYYASQSGQHVHQLVANMIPKRLSARELNMLKRKAKVNAKDQPKGWSEEDDFELSHSQTAVAIKSTCPDSQISDKVLMNTVVDDDDFENDGDGRWPFYHFIEQLIHDMFDPIWEVRHGSVMALREVLTHQGSSAGVSMPDLSSEKSWPAEAEDNNNLINPTKSMRKLDPNIQLAGVDSEPRLKRQKFEDKSRLGHGLIKGPLELESETSERFESQCKEEVDSTVEQNLLLEDGSSDAKMDLLTNLPEGCKLMTLVKGARHSWMKNWEFLQDCAIRLLCVLSLDRFGDYVSDQVVAPVRETCAQALGAVLKYMHPTLVRETLNILLQMQHRQEWEIRHGSLLGIKYLVAVRQEMLQDLLPFIVPACKLGLEDPDDDVRAVAAEALIPAAPAIVSLNGAILHPIVMLLWDILLDLDDLSPSTSSVMNLLAEIYSQPEMIPKMLASTSLEGQELDLNQMVQFGEHGDGIKSEENPYVLSTLAPRLWPFMRHSITSVRHATIRTMERLLEAGCRSTCDHKVSSLWPTSILGDALRIVFQNLLLESHEEILQCSERVWRLLLQCSEWDLEATARSNYSSWIQLATTPYGSPLDATKMFWPVAIPRKSHFRAAAKMRAVKMENECNRNFGSDPVKDNSLHEKSGEASSNFTRIFVGADCEKSVTCTRVVTATALGILASKLPESSLQFVIDPLWNNLSSLSGVQRQVASMVVVAWFRELKSRDAQGMHASMLGFVNNLREWLLDLLACTDPSLPTKDSRLPYSELSRTYTKMRSEATLLFRIVDSSGLFKNVLSAVNLNMDTASVDDAISFASKISLPTDNPIGKETAERHILDEIESSKQKLLSTSGYLRCVQGNLHVSVSALVASAVVWMSELPPRLNPVILPLMASVKREQEEILQQKAAEALAELVCHCITRRPGPNDKLIKNLCSLICMDPCETPQIALISSTEIIEDHDLLSFGRGSRSQKTLAQMLSAGEDRSKVEGFISRRGSEFVLKYLSERLGQSLFEKLPKLWDCLTEVLKPESSEGAQITDDQEMTRTVNSVKYPQTLINNIQVVRSLAPMIDETSQPKLLSLLPCIFACVGHNHVAVRLAASRCIASMAKSMTTHVMGAVIEKVIPMLRNSELVHARQGAGMLVSLLVQGLGVELVPYASLLVVPLLGCMSDCDPAVRQSVTHSFAALVPLLPLTRGLPPPVGLGESLSRNTEDALFLEQLLDNSHISDYKLSTELNVTLRRYQQEGINWLSFLKRFKLHGILCDDMGLGKTLQAAAILASDIAEQRASNINKGLLSLIICPSTLVGHWAYEIEKYIDMSVVIPLQYVGSVQERASLRDQFKKYNVIITSYDVIRKDVEHLSCIVWNYCILDEGHIIKNSKSKITTAVKQLKAEHRLILSGTPIQNNVLELWSLFDFLMPGFLGTERQFNAAYGKPLMAAKDSKCSAKDAEAGALAMEALHKQVMPFLLRRTKDEVLSDLPEKIIQDRYCDLSAVQLKLYEQFSGSGARKEVFSIVTEMSNTTDTNSSPKASANVFQALQYLLKLCSHPLLVLGENPPDSVLHIVSELIPGSSSFISDLHELHHSPKLVALQEILEECGIGLDGSNSDGAAGVGQHRVLIFAQHRSFLDIIERDLFQTHMKSVTYLRLDGSVEPEKRFDIVRAFNSDPTIDILLLTTHVGGLGLNLTSADTLIFMEHDWNPMRDHQAMDRAHRLGQRKVVNVHRLIMRGTLEEKVMSLQKFKMSIANAVINADNASLRTMNTDQLLDLFTPTQTGRKGALKSSKGILDEDLTLKARGKGLKAILSGLEDLWDQSQYTEEYNLSQFLAKLNG